MFSMVPPSLRLGVVLLIVAASSLALAQSRPPGGGKRGPGDEGRGEARMPTLAFRTEVPEHPVDIILGRPTDSSVVASILCYQESEGQLAYRPESGGEEVLTPRRPFKAGEPAVVTLTSLRPNTRYTYHFLSGSPAQSALQRGPAYRFTTARPAGSRFVFAVQADPHLDFGIDPAIYRKSLANALAAQPDFFIDLGDTFMTDKRSNYRDALPQYVAQRYYFGLIAHSAPLFLVLGNHDGEMPSRGGGEEMSVWSNGQRKRYFPNPEPEAFYTGNATPHPRAGLLQDYYAFVWGDALFVMLDPYWFGREPGKAAGDNWGRSLGREQYEWLRRTLAAHATRYTFVFLHNLVGGETREGRGGAEAAAFFEWGGRGLDGVDRFAAQRPGWAAPIHTLLAARPGVIVFHGHDHLYARQERDGVIYQLVPQPGHSRFDNTRSAEEYGYKQGVIQGASGILRVTVDPAETLVEYVRAYPDSAENEVRRTGGVTHRYLVPGRLPR